jgi:parallel beta-helix repeat protein
MRSVRTVVITALLLVVGVTGPVEAQEGSIGIVDTATGEWYLRDPGNGATTKFFYGNPGDLPMVGDWDCDGDETPGLYRQSDGFVYLRNSNSQGVADIRFFFGNPGDIPLAGDFNGDRCDTVSIYRPSEERIYVINALGANDGGLGAADFSYVFGNPGDKPFVGDFNGDGIDTVGLHRETTGLVYFRQSHTQGIADSQFIFGDPGDKMDAAEWAGRGAPGPESVGLFRPSNCTSYLRHTNTQGNADQTLSYGLPTGSPVAGNFGLLPGGGGPPPGCVAAPERQTLIPVGASWNPIIAAEPAGTTFIVQSGVHYRQTAHLKHGDSLIGQPGAVMDGRNVTAWAVQPNNANDVTIKGLEIRNYNPKDQYAPITARTYEGATAGVGWTIENCDLHHNSYAGLALSEGSIARNNKIHDNGVIGLEVSWVRHSGAIVEGNEIYGNNTTGADEYYEAGGSKFGETENLIVRDNFVHDNNGPGLWTDTDNINTLYENNVVVGNSGAGIFHEISYSATIRNNQVRGNGFRNRGWLWEGGIMVAGSQGVEIYGNVLEDNFNGVTLIQQNRGSGALGPYLLKNVSVHDNIVVRSGRTGAVQDVGDLSIYSTRNITFQNNHYMGIAGFSWADRSLDWTQWRGYGMDLTGSNS